MARFDNDLERVVNHYNENFAETPKKKGKKS